MLMPKRVKHRKQFRGSMAGKCTKGNTITNGSYGLISTEPCWIKSNQIEAARVAMTRYIKRGGKVWIKIFPDKPVTAKPAETRMGSGKGSTEYWVAVVKPGRVLFEIADVPDADAKEALRLAMHKLPCKCKIEARDTVNVRVADRQGEVYVKTEAEHATAEEIKARMRKEAAREARKAAEEAGPTTAAAPAAPAAKTSEGGDKK